MQVIVNDLMTSYSRSGTGKTVLILPGWADNSAGWQSFARTLGKHYDVVVLDLPGFGGSQPPAEPWALNEYVDFIAAFVSKLKLKPYAVIGHSNGGSIAIRGLASGIMSADKLVLLASAGVRSEQAGRKRALKAVAKIGKTIAKPLPTHMQKRLRATLYKRAGSDMLVAEHMQETFKKIVVDDVVRDAAELRVPTLLLYGQDDTATPVRHGMLLHERIAGSTLEIVNGAGHFLHLDDETKVIQLVEEFLK